MKKRAMLIGMAIAIAFQGLNPLQWMGELFGRVEAGFTRKQNENAYVITFNDTSAIATANLWEAGVKIDGGAMSLNGGNTGEITTRSLEGIKSIKNWHTIDVDASFPYTSKIFVTALDCATDIPISGAINLEYNQTTSSHSISGVDAHILCMRLKVSLEGYNHNGNIFSPSLNKITVHYTPLPVQTTSMESIPSTVNAGGNITYKILYQNSYAEETGLVLYVPLPTLANGITTPAGTESPYAAQLPNGASATIFNDGKYTSTAITVNGVLIPANSIYWNLGVVSAGIAGATSFVIKVPDDQVNGTKYHLKSYIQGERGENLKQSTEITTTITSSPNPVITKTASNVMRWNNQDYAYVAGGNTLVKYSIQLTNIPPATEALRNPTIKDDLTDIWDKLQTSCGVTGTLDTYIKDISDGGVLNVATKTISWTIPRIGRGGSATVSFSLDISGCSGVDASLMNTTTAAGSNFTNKTTNHLLKLLHLLKAEIGFSKREASWVSGKKYYDGDLITYRLSVSNVGPLRVKEITISDVVPSTIQLTLADGGRIVTNQIGTVSRSGNTVIATSSGSINSPHFRGDPSTNSDYEDSTSFIVEIPGKINMGTGFCQSKNIFNTGFATIEQVSTSHFNADTDLTYKTIENNLSENSQNIVVYPKAPELVVNVTADKHGMLVAKVNDKITYTVTVKNNGRGATAADTQLVITPPTATIMGSGMQIPLFKTDNSPLGLVGGKVYVPLGIIAAGGTSPSFKFTMEIPQGAIYDEQIQLNVGVQANDPNGCSVGISPQKINLTVDGMLKLALRKESGQGYILSGRYVEYQLYARNMGDTSTSQAWIIDRISDNASFVEAYLTGHAAFMDYNCEGCEVRFATSADLPTEFDPLQPFTESMMSGALAKFKSAKQNAEGARIPGDGENYIPLEQVKYVAYLIDEKVNSSKVFPPSLSPRIVGIKLQEKGTTLGRSVINEIAGFSKDLLFTIGEPKRVGVNLYPGLSPELYSTKINHDKLKDPKIVEVCKPFIWEAPYYNNGTEPDQEATLTLLLPNHTTLYTGVDAITHIWSAETLSGLSGLPMTEQSIENEPFITVTGADEPYSTSILFDITQYLGTGLQHGEDGMKGRGGILRVKVVPDCNIISNTELTAKLIGFYNVDDVKYGRSENTDTVIIQNPDLEIKKTIQGYDPKTKPEFIVGEQVGYVLNITNHGNAPAIEVVVEDTLPQGMCYVTGSAKMTVPTNKLREPIIVGDCEQGEQVVLKWIDLTYPGTNTGTIPGKGKFQIMYSGFIMDTVPLGTELENRAVVTTETKQDDLYPHEDEEIISIPKPDLRVEITSPKTVDGGASFAYTIKYNNKTITQQEKPYLIITLPNRTTTTTTDPGVKFGSIATGASDEQVYYLACPYVGTSLATDRESDAFPTFDRENPTSGGWTATTLANPCYIAVKIDQPLKKSASNRKLTLYVQATDPATNKKIDAGTRLTGEVMITGLLPDANPTDNYANSITKVPAIDLWVRINATPSGLVPGVLPGGTITYRVEFGNAGKEQSCGNLISITGDIHLTIKDATIDFTTLTLENSLELPVDPTDPRELPITTPVSITTTPKSNGYTFEIGDLDVCIPGGTQGSFTFQADVKKEVLDSTTVDMATSIWATDGQIEDYLDNNYDIVETYIYRPDVITRKTGISSSDPGGETAKAGDDISYTVHYDNIGNYDAENTLITETIPDSTCFIVGSIGGVYDVEYTTGIDGTGNKNRDYIPVADGNGQDCAVREFRVDLGRLGAPRNQLFGEFKMGNGYYIIYADDPKYPNGCNDLNLYDPYNYCILAIPYDTEYLYVAPGSTDQPKTKGEAIGYCTGMNIGTADWHLPTQSPLTWGVLYDAKGKVNNLVAQGASKPEHYRVIWSFPIPSTNNCALSGGDCGTESSTTATLGVRCVTTMNPLSEIEKYDTHIQLTAEITVPNQTVKINKYFANNHTIDRGDGTATTNHINDTIHTYISPGTYTITLALTGGATRWNFLNKFVPLVPQPQTTANNVYVSTMPDFSLFGDSSTNVGDYFFQAFNAQGAITSLPIGSFNTNKITTVGRNFFAFFNREGILTSLPLGSFNINKITVAQNRFFSAFNTAGSLTSLPSGSFNTSNITTTASEFFAYFNNAGSLTTLPRGSFDTTNITTMGDSFFMYFNREGALTSLPTSFKRPALDGTQINQLGNFQNAFDSPSYTLNTNAVDIINGIVLNNNRSTFSSNQPGLCDIDNNWKVTPGTCTPTIDTTAIQLTAEITAPIQTVQVSKYFANAHTIDRGDSSPVTNLTAHTTHTYTSPGTYVITLALTGGATRWTFKSAPALVQQFGTTANNVYVSYMPDFSLFGDSPMNVGDDFFSNFNTAGALASLPAGSFDTSNIITVGDRFFYNFNFRGFLVNLPAGSFDTSNITIAEWGPFYQFNYYGLLTSLPEGSFNISKITTVEDDFFSRFNLKGSLTSLPKGSFRFSSGLTTVGDCFFYEFNEAGALTSLPAGSFNTDNITTVGDRFIGLFNCCGSTGLTTLPEGSFNTSKITTAGKGLFEGFNVNGPLTSLPEGSFDTSNITTLGAEWFFHQFNYQGAITDLPKSFKRPALDVTNASKNNNFVGAFDSPSYTLNRNAAAIINGSATPNTNRSTFSSNQPGLCVVDNNWKASPGAACTPALPEPPTPPSTGDSTIGSYLTTGSMTKSLLAPTGLVKRENFILDYTIGDGAQVQVEFYTTPTLSGDPLYTFINHSVIENLSSYISNYKGDLYLHVTVLSGPAEVRSYKITYESDSPVPSFTFDVKVKKVGLPWITEPLSGSIINKVNISTTTQPEIRNDNNDGEYSLTTVTTDLRIHKTANKTAVLTGDEFIYTITYGNSGAVAAENVVIIDELPSELSIESPLGLPTTGALRNTNANAYVLLALPSLPAGSGGTVTLTVRANTGVVGSSYTNRVYIISDTAETTYENNLAKSIVALGEVANLKTKTTILESNYTPEGAVTAIVTYANDGNQLTLDNTLTITLDPNLTFISASLSGYAYNSALHTLTRTFDELDPGTTANITLHLQVANDRSLVDTKTILTVATMITTSTLEITLLDNPSSATIGPVGSTGADLVVIKGNVFIDRNNNYRADLSDILLPGQKVVLYSGSEEIAETMTVAGGRYEFLVRPGTYQLKVYPSIGYVSLFSRGGTWISNPLTAVGIGSYDGATPINEIISISVSPDQSIENLDFGLKYSDQHISGKIRYVDGLGNRIAPASGIVVYLNSGPTTTGTGGLFNSLDPTDNDLFDDPNVPRSEETSDPEEGTENQVPEPEEITDITDEEELNSQESKPSLKRVKNPTELAEIILQGVISYDLFGGGTHIAVITTDGGGNYLFTGNFTGTYYITYGLISPATAYQSYPGKNPETDIRNATGLTIMEIEVTVDLEESSEENNFEIQTLLGDIIVGVYYDQDDNDVYTYGIDTLLGGVTVLLTGESVETQTGITPALNAYHFASILDGTYTASYDTSTLPSGYLPKSFTSATIIFTGETLTIYFPVKHKVPFDLGIQKTVDKYDANKGDILTYKLTITNYGNEDVGTNIEIKDTLPEGVIYNNDADLLGVQNGREIVFIVDELQPGASKTITFTVTLPNNITSTTNYTNIVKITDSTPVDTNPANNEASVTTKVTVGGGGGGGGGCVGPACGLKIDDCPCGDSSPSRYDGTCGTPEPVCEEPPTCKGDECEHESAPEIEEIEIEEDDFEEYFGLQTFKYPDELPKTGPEQVVFSRTRVIRNAKVYTTYPEWFKPSTDPDIKYWKSLVYPIDRNAEKYLVIPKLGAVAPIGEMTNTGDRQHYLSGIIKNVDINKYLQHGVLKYPGTANYGENGNAVLMGHSSYFKQDEGRYKTVFQSIIGLNQGDSIWIYERQGDETYKQYEYIVEKSYETGPKHVEVLAPGYGRNLTLITCTPIGGVTKRWIVQARMPIQKVIDKPELPQQVVKKITNQEMIEKILKALENKDAEQKTYALKMLQQYGR